MGHSCCESKTSELLKLKEKQKTVLKTVLLINAAMFFVEFIYGLITKSSALKADSLDMLGDAIVYGFSLYVLSREEIWKARAAFIKGVIIVGFALFVLFDTTVKVLTPGVPIAETMGVVGLLALIANVSCLLLLLRHRHDDINMRSTFICSRNDIISNTGVIAASVLVYLTQNKWPDIIIGYIIAVLFLRSAWPILRDSVAHLQRGKATHYHTQGN